MTLDFSIAIEKSDKEWHPKTGCRSGDLLTRADDDAFEQAFWGEIMGKIEGAAQTEESIRALLKTQKLAVLSTQSDGQPYASLVAFVASEDLKHIYFSTARSTRKYNHLAADPRVAMLIDSRSNQDSDFHAATAVTATGTAAEVPDQEKGHIIELYLSKHPYLQDFVWAESCALVGVAVRTYYFVTRFQQVMELHIRP